MQSKDFTKGFVKGFTMPFSFFLPEPIKLPEGFDGSVEEAWAEVGQLLNNAIEEQGEYIEQGFGKNPRRADSEKE